MEVLVILVLIVVLFVWWVKRRGADWRTRRDLKIVDEHYAKQAGKEGASVQSDGGLGASSKALEIAAERYASGEISKDEFEEMKASLQTPVERKDKPQDPGLWA